MENILFFFLSWFVPHFQNITVSEKAALGAKEKSSQLIIRDVVCDSEHTLVLHRLTQNQQGVRPMSNLK